MKSKKFAAFTKKSFLSALVLIILISLSSCATNAKFETSTVVPAAQGTVKIKKNHNNNNEIQIEISNLAESERLTPSKNTYVVWMVSDQG